MQKISNFVCKNLFAGFKLRHCFAAQRALTMPVQPQQYELNLVQSENLPLIVRKKDDILIKQWWSQTCFEQDKQLIVPVFNFQTGEYSGEGVELPQDLFNVPLRRDLVHRVMLWRKNLFYIRTHRTRDKGTTAGSGKKPSPQKGQGRARRGNKRAPQMRKGGKAHGAKPRIMRYPLSKKVRLQALQVMLSAKLAEGKLRIVDNESIETPKTKYLSEMFDNNDPTARILFVHSYTPDSNFLLAVNNIKRVQICEPNRLNILKLLKQDKIVITKDGLQQLIQDLKDRKFLQYRARIQKREPLVSEVQRSSLQEPVPEETRYEYDPSRPLKFKFQILNDYLDQYENVRKEGTLDDYKIKY